MIQFWVFIVNRGWKIPDGNDFAKPEAQRKMSVFALGIKL